MDLGLGNLIELKRHLLAESLRSQTAYDTVITNLGRGVAVHFEKVCNRKFARVVGDTIEFTADRDHFILPRYPVESITAITQKDTEVDGFVALTLAEAIETSDAKSGYVYFGAQMGDSRSFVRLTWTGGFWYDTAETENTAQPAGSTLTPYDLKLAWYLQCTQVWGMRDRLGLGIGDKPDSYQALSALELIPQVKDILRPYTRYMIS